MNLVLVSVMSTLVLWAVVSGGAERARLTAPLALVITGAVVALASDFRSLGSLDLHQLEKLFELVLAVVLFLDATEVRGGIFGSHPRTSARLLGLALPLSIVAGVVAGSFVLPELDPALLLVLACVVVPTDLAPAMTALRHPRLSQRVRDVLNVESGYNDGIVAPIFLFALILAGGHTTHTTSWQSALREALPASVKAVVVGAAVAAAFALALRFAGRRGWTTDAAVRVGVAATPLLVYGLTSLWHGNGFVAAFVAGVVFHALRRPLPPRELDLAEDLGLFATLAMWFGFGSLVVVALYDGIEWRSLVFGLLALTVVRIVPVLLSLLGGSLSWPERWAVALVGPRGIASIVFALLAVTGLTHDDYAPILLEVLAVVVIGSIVLHGVVAPAVLSRTRTADAATD